MIASEQKRFHSIFEQHLRALKLQGYSASSINVYARAVRRVSEHFDWESKPVPRRCLG